VERAIRARSVWTGTISFGLVSIPVRLYPAHRSSGVSLRMLSEDGTPLARRYYDPETDREVARDDIVRGYEVEKDEFVVVTEQELEAVEPEKNRDIDLRRFVDADELDPVFFERAYFLTPDGDSTKAYRLLAAVMEDSGRAGIATFVMRTKEYLIAILAENGILRAETLRFHDEIRSVERIDLPDRPEAAAEWVESVRAAIREATEDELDEDELRDDYSRRLRSLAESKRSSGVDVREAPPEVAGGDGTDVIDLMEVLKRSLQGGEARAAEPRGADGEPTGGRTAGGSASSGRLQELTKAELYERAQALDIPGRSSMKKDELVDAIQRTG
jgi:DNA end-binding protein Ku